MRAWLVAVSIGFAVIGTSCATAPPPIPVRVPPEARVTFSGHVADSDNYQPLENTAVELAYAHASNQPIAAQVTDTKGEFTFTNLDPGAYVVRVGRPGYNDFRMRVEVLRSDQKPLEIRMRSLRQRCLPSRYHTIDCP